VRRNELHNQALVAGHGSSVVLAEFKELVAGEEGKIFALLEKLAARHGP
jgi:hypothetical protein